MLTYVVVGTNTAGATRSPSPSSPTVGVNTSKTEGGDRPGTTKCKVCSKPVENTHFDAHLKHCQDQRKADQRKARDAKRAREAKAKAKEAEEAKEKSGDSDPLAGDRPTTNTNGAEKADTNGDTSAQATKKPPKKSAPSATKMTDGPKKSKKRKGDELEGGTEKEPKKKKAKKAADAATTAAANGTSTSTPNAGGAATEPPKPKLPKPKGPVNVELQCGVALPNGGFCARSLTCKSHSMGAKRSVPGRSAPYDTLLQQYQKKNQAKQQKLALANQAIEHAAAEDVEGAEGATVDSEEEREAVMRAVSRGWGGMPLEQYFHMGSRRRYLAVRRREGLQQALAGGKLFAAPSGLEGGPRGSVSGGVGIGGGGSPEIGGPDDTASRRASLAQALSGKGSGGGGGGAGGGAGGGGGGTGAGAGPPSRKASVASVSGSVGA